MRRSGYALASVLLLASVVLVVALTIAAIGSYNLMNATHEANERAALARADGLVREICAQFAQSPTYGIGLGGVLTFPTGAPPVDQCAQATFDPTQVQLPTSTNNSDGQHGVGWNNTPVPSGSAVIYAVGRANSVTKTVEATVQVPNFPYVIASDGDAYLPGGLVLQSANSMQQYVTDSQTNGSLSATLPASLGVNGQLTLDGPAPSIIQGDVVYGGTLNITGTANVKVGGAIRQNAVEVPQISVLKIELGALAVGTTTPGTGDVSLDSKAVYYINAPGGYNINSLTLANSELFVDGPLNVTGGISGIGGVFVNGNVTVGGNTVLNTDGNVALVSQGDVTLNGAGNYFQGLVYAHGIITAQNITVVGAMLAASGGLDPPNIKLIGPNTQVVYVPDVLNINLQATPNNSEWCVSGIANPMLVVNWTVPPGNYLGGDLVNGLGTPLGPQYSDDLGQDAIPMGLQASNPAFTPAEVAENATLIANLNAAMALTPQAAAWSALENGTLGTSNPDMQWDRLPGSAASISLTALHYDCLNNRFEMWDPPLIYYEDPSQKLITAAQFDASARAVGLSLDQCIDAMLTAQTVYMNIANNMLAAAPPPAVPPLTPVPPYPIQMNLNRFLSTQNPVEITAWRSW